MFWRKRKEEKQSRGEPRLEPFVKFEVKYEPVTPQQIAAFQEKQRLLRYFDNDGYVPSEVEYEGEMERSFEEPFRQAAIQFQRDVEEAERPFRMFVNVKVVLPRIS